MAKRTSFRASWRQLQAQHQAPRTALLAKQRKARAALLKTSVDRDVLDRLRDALDAVHRKQRRDYDDAVRAAHRQCAPGVSVEAVDLGSSLRDASLDTICRVLECDSDVSFTLSHPRVHELINHVRSRGTDKQKRRLGNAIVGLPTRPGRQRRADDPRILERAQRMKTAAQMALRKVNRRFRSRSPHDEAYRHAVDQDVLIPLTGWTKPKRDQCLGKIAGSDPVDAAAIIAGKYCDLPTYVVRRLGRSRTVRKNRPD